MAKPFKDNLPLLGRVRLKGDGEIMHYVGYEGGNTRRCATVTPTCANIVWYDRNVLERVPESR